jgi:hypothetical protein
MTHYGRYDFSGPGIGSSQKALPNNTQPSDGTNIHALGGIQTRFPTSDRSHTVTLNRSATEIGIPLSYWRMYSSQISSCNTSNLISLRRQNAFLIHINLLIIFNLVFRSQSTWCRLTGWSVSHVLRWLPVSKFREIIANWRGSITQENRHLNYATAKIGKTWNV